MKKELFQKDQKRQPNCNGHVPVPVTQQIAQETKGLYSTDMDPAAAAQTAVSHTFLSQNAELTPITLKRMPRLSERGHLGMRAEHWYDFGE